MPTPHPEYPRPQLQRADWLNLNGQWGFAFDDANAGLHEGWSQPEKAQSFPLTITVPYPFQSQLSGIQDTDFHDVVWYTRTVNIPAAWAGKRVRLNIGAADYAAQVWVNGKLAGSHEGGHTPFSLDITDFLSSAGEQRITLRVEDDSRDLSQPRGKQYWEPKSASIFYTRTTGLWQTAWLEAVSAVHLSRLKFTPDIDGQQVIVGYELSDAKVEAELETEIRYNGQVIHQRHHKAETQTFAIEGTALHLWSPETPNLYEMTVRVVQGGQVVDAVESYFGMRKLDVQNGKVCLNNQPYMLRLILDQGYFPQSILAYPDDEALKQDVELTKAMGFNGARKHQKVEDPRYLYWADHLGLMVWGEMANSYVYTDKSVAMLTKEWQEAVLRDYNHPCIVAWVPLNESWGVPDIPNDPRQTDYLKTLYYLTKALDSTRLVISNDGWEHAKSDLLTIHDYTGDEPTLYERYQKLDSTLAWRPAGKALYVPTVTYSGEPIVITEFGGIAYRVSEQEGWGYTSATDSNSFARQLEGVFRPMYRSPLVQGFCYTQLTDVEQEINGLLTYDRRPKLLLETIHKIVTGQ